MKTITTIIALCAAVIFLPAASAADQNTKKSVAHKTAVHPHHKPTKPKTAIVAKKHHKKASAKKVVVATVKKTSPKTTSVTSAKPTVAASTVDKKDDQKISQKIDHQIETQKATIATPAAKTAKKPTQKLGLFGTIAKWFSHKEKHSLSNTSTTLTHEVRTLASWFGGDHDKHHEFHDRKLVTWDKKRRKKIVCHKKVRVLVVDDCGTSTPLVNSMSPCVGFRTENVKGVALPAKVICDRFNLPPIPNHFNKAYWEKWQCVRESAVEVTHLDTGVKKIYPFADIGPGKDGLAHGYGIDLTVSAMKELAGAKSVANGSIRVAYKILPGYYARKTKTLLAKR